MQHLRPGLSIRLACAALLALTPQKLAAQFVRNTPATDHLNVYLECGGRGYDLGFYQEQLQWVRWVTEPANADVVAALFGSKRQQLEDLFRSFPLLEADVVVGPSTTWKASGRYSKIQGNSSRRSSMPAGILRLLGERRPLGQDLAAVSGPPAECPNRAGQCQNHNEP